MNNKALTILGIAAVAMVALAVMVADVTNKKEVRNQSSINLIQGLDPAIISSIEVSSDGDKVTLKRVEGKFVVVEKSGYPASSDDINKLVIGCMDIKQSEVYTSNAKNHVDLEVTPETAKTIVTFKNAQDNVITGVIIGKSREQGQGTFVRLINDDSVYVAQNVPMIKSSAVDYMNKELLSLGLESIESVTVNGPEEIYTVKSETETEGLSIEGNIPSGKQFKGTDPSSVLNALSYLGFTDVQSADKANLDFDRMYICRTKDSTEYKVKIAKNDGNTWVAVSAEFTDKTPIVKGKGIETEEELRNKEMMLIARDDATKFTLKHEKWVYEIPSSKVEWLTKPLAAIIEDVPVAEAPAGPMGPRRLPEEMEKI